VKSAHLVREDLVWEDLVRGEGRRLPVKSAHLVREDLVWEDLVRGDLVLVQIAVSWAAF
jgi:hypothetical protein